MSRGLGAPDNSYVWLLLLSITFHINFQFPGAPWHVLWHGTASGWAGKYLILDYSNLYSVHPITLSIYLLKSYKCYVCWFHVNNLLPLRASWSMWLRGMLRMLVYTRIREGGRLEKLSHITNQTEGLVHVPLNFIGSPSQYSPVKIVYLYCKDAVFIITI